MFPEVRIGTGPNPVMGHPGISLGTLAVHISNCVTYDDLYFVAFQQTIGSA